MYAKILQGLLQRFFQAMGRAPRTPNEWSKLRRQAMEFSRKQEEGIPSIKKDPFQGWDPKIVPKVEEKITIDELLKGPVRSK